jgi:hypothetical protein
MILSYLVIQIEISYFMLVVNKVLEFVGLKRNNQKSYPMEVKKD